jgi:hypothetical protein
MRQVERIASGGLDMSWFRVLTLSNRIFLVLNILGAIVGMG